MPESGRGEIHWMCTAPTRVVSQSLLEG
ncbi:hypothetical protein Goklo_025186 [Gossypium klotzschianum]|uniref:Uncharacterized protein n=1 Tax=Gossypium klotzschianum TaxID=34286 RepID=A0A7J8WDH7_9ROSI|nr:hypothetical protein [Gossypium klotzschianum]